MTEKKVIEFPMAQEQGDCMEEYLETTMFNVSVASHINEFAKKIAQSFGILSIRVSESSMLTMLSGAFPELSDEDGTGKKIGPVYYGEDAQVNRYQLDSIYQPDEEGTGVYIVVHRKLPDGRLEYWDYRQGAWNNSGTNEWDGFLDEYEDEEDDEDMELTYTPCQEKLLQSGNPAGDFLQEAVCFFGELTDQEFNFLCVQWKKLLGLYDKVYSFMGIIYFNILEKVMNVAGPCLVLEPYDRKHRAFLLHVKMMNFFCINF